MRSTLREAIFRARRDDGGIDLATRASDHAGRFLDGFTEREHENELSLPEQIHDLAVGTRPEHPVSDDEKPRSPEVGTAIRVEALQGLDAAPHPRKSNARSPQPRRDTELDEIPEGITAA